MREEMRSHAALAVLADAQYGVVSHRQLRRLGFSAAAIGRSCAADRLLRVHRGVYAVGHSSISDHGRCMAAVLACGDRAVLSHASAGWLWGLLPKCPVEAEVTVPRHGRRRSGIKTHHPTSLGLEEWGTLERIPVTSLARTLLDLAATGPRWRLEQAIERAERLGRLDLIEIDALLRRRHGEAGTRRLLRALSIYRDPASSHSRTELLFLDLIKKAKLPRPATNTFVAGYEIDAYWDAERFAVEVDGWDTHRTRKAFESDPLRQEDLKLAGIDSIRITARRIEREPQLVARRLATLLAQRRRDLRRQA
jgi:predicted transcriptional regulator of viral defense system/very-short-patch-repair endonuclease